MKKILLLATLALACVSSAYAIKEVETSTLNLIGKPFASTPNPYQRVDTVKYKGFNPTENRQMRCPVGMAVLFKTNTKNIRVATKWGYIYSGNSTTQVSFKGYDLYIKDENGKWLYASSKAAQNVKLEKNDTVDLISNMDGKMHECMLYLPMYSEVRSCKLGIDDDATIEPLQSEFRHRIAFYGSSFTQGVSTDRSSMSYPMQFMRNTGLQVVSLATSGRCFMQSYMADVLADVEADAYIFDTFSNPDSAMIKERFFPFLERMLAAHPGKPLIFQRTIYRERRNFDTALDARERAKAAAVEELFAQIKGDKKYKDVYLITPNATSEAHDTSVDGTHPGISGYTLWEKSIEKPVLKILKKYGIK